jgi:hypothetical protein
MTNPLTIFLIILKKLQPCKVGGVPGLGQAEQFCKLSVHMLSCLYSTPGDGLA